MSANNSVKWWLIIIATLFTIISIIFQSPITITATMTTSTNKKTTGISTISVDGKQIKAINHPNGAIFQSDSGIFCNTNFIVKNGHFYVFTSGSHYWEICNTGQSLFAYLNPYQNFLCFQTNSKYKAANVTKVANQDFSLSKTAIKKLVAKYKPIRIISFYQFEDIHTIEKLAKLIQTVVELKPNTRFYVYGLNDKWHIDAFARNFESMGTVISAYHPINEDLVICATNDNEYDKRGNNILGLELHDEYVEPDYSKQPSYIWDIDSENVYVDTYNNNKVFCVYFDGPPRDLTKKEKKFFINCRKNLADWKDNVLIIIYKNIHHQCLLVIQIMTVKKMFKIL